MTLLYESSFLMSNDILNNSWNLFCNLREDGKKYSKDLIQSCIYFHRYHGFDISELPDSIQMQILDEFEMEKSYFQD